MQPADDYRGLFLSEAADHLLSMVDGLLELESEPSDADAVESVFRAAHNLKSMAAAMGCDRTAQHVHRMESLMDSVRRGARPADRALVDRMLRSVDEARRLVEVESGGRLPAHLSGGTEHALAPSALEAVSDVPPARIETADTTIRVSVNRIDDLVDLTARLDEELGRLALLADDEPHLAGAIADLRDVAGALRREVMLTRTVAVGELFRRYPRMVRDLGRELGKDVALMIDGLDVELDRAVVDRIADPIAHVLRNAVDHGVERPVERVAAGKPPRGVIRLSAARSDGEVVVSVSDDGAGIDAALIWEEAVRRGLADPEDRARTSDDEVRLMCFRPGFTTVKTATQVSGHGVGLDVVFRAVRRVGGIVAVRSVPGRGTTLVLRLPVWLGHGGASPAAPTLFPSR